MEISTGHQKKAKRKMDSTKCNLRVYLFVFFFIEIVCYLCLRILAQYSVATTRPQSNTQTEQTDFVLINFRGIIIRLCVVCVRAKFTSVFALHTTKYDLFFFFAVRLYLDRGTDTDATTDTHTLTRHMQNAYQ